MSRTTYRPWRMNTPRWWRNVMTNRPLRRQAQRLANRAVKAEVDDLEELQEEMDPPNKVRPYYW